MTPLILVVEDDPVVRLLERKQLDRLGYRTNIVSTGEEAVQHFNSSVDLLLMDIGLPGIDGLETTALIRKAEADQGLKRVPIIAVTAHSDRELCLLAGMDGFLQKPVLLKELKETLESWLPAQPPA